MQYRVFHIYQPLPEVEPEFDVAWLVLVGYDTKDVTCPLQH